MSHGCIIHIFNYKFVVRNKGKIITLKKLFIALDAVR